MLNTVESRWGPCTYFLKDEYVGRSIHNYLEYNPDETEKILELAVPGKICLDIGANIGCISMALERNGFHVEAFEPQLEVFKVLCSNVNGGKHNVGLGSVAGMAKMPKVHYSSKGNFGGLEVGSSSAYGTVDVEIRTLDSYEFDNVGFIKIDVEGFEEEVLRGGVETITRCKPVMYIEDDRLDKSASLRKYISSLGYYIEEHKPCLYRENNHKGLMQNVWDRNYASHNLICYANN
jgi:FkbM family methyltransferase